jgi:hypothetical protein
MYMQLKVELGRRNAKKFGVGGQSSRVKPPGIR